MKNIKSILTLAISFVTLQVFAQTDKETTNKIVNDTVYTFTANSATPTGNQQLNDALLKMGGGQGAGRINLTGSNYDLKVTKDSLVAFLPYYGRAYNVSPSNINEGGIKFKSKNFSYKTTKNKKGSYTIRIRTNDLNSENYDLTLSISQNGYASLVASSNNKQPITFDGYLEQSATKQ
jgi:hypothetical protein